MGRQDEIIQEKLKKLAEMRKKGINPYPQKFEKKSSAADIKQKYSSLKPEEFTKEKTTVAGRVMTVRDMGKIAFMTIQDGQESLQLVLQDGKTPQKVFDLLKSFVDSGDIIGAEGIIFRTKRGEISILVESLEMLTKSINVLPDKWHGLEDKEERYRKRYVDLIMNSDVKKTFAQRAKLVDTVRTFLKEQNFLEVETPTLQSIYGGASAAPFKTHLNALDIPLYLSISPELYLKRLTVGGFERVFTICKNFRNEGIDRQHNPEFTMLEYYAAYQNYEYHIWFTEELFKRFKQTLSLREEIEYQGKKISLKLPFKRIRFRDLLIEEIDLDINKANTYEKLKEEIEKRNLKQVNIRECKHYGALLDELYKRVVRPTIIQPTFLTHYPVEMIALAKRNEEDPTKINSVQLIIDGAEIVKAYDELNDPIDQEMRLKEQAELLNEGSADAMPMDTDFIEALKYGLPPTAGFGMGIDRITMLLTNSPSIRDVILFPFMKPEIKSTVATKEKETKEEKKSSGKRHPEIPSIIPEGKMVSRKEALDLLKEYVKSESLQNHCLAVGKVMRAYANKFRADEELWEITGFLHDFDYENFPNKHTIAGTSILIEKKYPKEIIQAILSHYTTFTGIPRTTQMEKVLFAVDELTGLVTALSKVKPDKFDSMTAESVEKALKKKEFARNVSREDVEEGIKELGIDRKEHFELVIKALKEYNNPKEEKESKKTEKKKKK